MTASVLFFNQMCMNANDFVVDIINCVVILAIYLVVVGFNSVLLV